MAEIATSADWWTSTKSPASMFRPAYQTKAMDAFLRETVGIDPAVLAIDAGMSANRVEAYQRQLGLRKITGNAPRRDRKAP